MKSIQIVTDNTIVGKLLERMVASVKDCDPVSHGQIVLLDVEAMERMSEFSGSKVILFTDSFDPAYLSTGREAGADGFWYITPSTRELAQVLREKHPFPEKAPGVQLGKIQSDMLTKREMEVLREVVAGKTDAQIGETLNLAIPTVKHHLQQMLLKTGFSNRTQLAVAAVRTRLIQMYPK